MVSPCALPPLPIRRPLHPYQEPAAASDVAQGQRDVQKHDGIADHNREDIAVTFSVQLIFDTSFSSERNGQIWILIVTHKVNEPKEEAEYYVFS